MTHNPQAAVKKFHLATQLGLQRFALDRVQQIIDLSDEGTTAEQVRIQLHCDVLDTEAEIAEITAEAKA